MAVSPKRRYAPRLPPDERREQLLDAALGLLREAGYEGVSMEGVARAAGVTKPVVYDFFANRGALLRSLLEREEGRALADLAAAMTTDDERPADPDDVLVEGLRAFLEAVRRRPDGWRLILLPADGTPQVVREHVEAGRATVLTQVVALVEWGLAERGGPAGMDVELLSTMIVGVGEHLARLVLTAPDAWPPDRIAAGVAQLISALPRG